MLEFPFKIGTVERAISFDGVNERLVYGQDQAEKLVKQFTIGECCSRVVLIVFLVIIA